MSDSLAQQRSTATALWGPVAFVLALLASAGFSTVLFSPDSWSYYELSKTVFGDFYHANTIRQFEFVTEYSNSFPPLFPCLIAVIDKLTHLEERSGLLLNWLIAGTTVHALIGWGRSLRAPDCLCWLLPITLLANHHYVEEVRAARAIPLAVLLLILALRAAGAADLKPACILLSGGCAALAALTRFDCLLPVLGFGMVLVVASRTQRLRTAALYYGIVLLVLSPWMLYSQHHFGRLLASDNARTAMLVAPSFVMDYFPDTESLQTIGSAPAAWLKSVLFSRTVPVLKSLLFGLLDFPFLIFIAGWWAGRGCERPVQMPPRVLGLVTIVAALQIGTACLTGYGDARYFCFAMHALGVTLLLAAHRPEATSVTSAMRRVLCAAAVLCVFMAFVQVRQQGLAKTKAALAPGIATVTTGQMVQALHADATVPRVLFVTSKDGADLDPYRFGALTGEKTFPTPSNLTATSLPLFLRTYQITHVYDLRGQFASVPGLTPAGSLQGLQRVLPVPP